MKRDVAKTLGVLYTTSHFKSFACWECRLKNILLGDAPSFTAATTQRFKDNSKTATAFQNIAMIWKEVTSRVK